MTKENSDAPDPENVADTDPEIATLLLNLRAARPSLEALVAQCSGEWGYEDPLYRLYHHSFKVYGVQSQTLAIVAALSDLAPARPLNSDFMAIVRAGTGLTFKTEDNRRWLEATRPIVEAFLHARFFLEMAIVYGRTLERPPVMMPSGWAALLHLFDLR